MHTYPEDFYYLATTSEPEFRAESGGKLNPTRLLRPDRKAWEKGSFALSIKPKCLIFNDWTAIAWSTGKKHRVIEALQQAIAAGHEIYFLDNKFNRLINAQRLFATAFKFDDYQQPKSHEIIMQKAAEAHIPIDHILILDDYRLT